MSQTIECVLTVSRIQRHYKEAVRSFHLGPQEYLVLISSTSKEWRLSRSWSHSWLEIHDLNHSTIAPTQAPKVLGSSPKHMVDQVWKPNLISRLAVTFRSHKIKWKREKQKFENLERKRRFFGKIKSFLIIFLNFYFDGKNKNSKHKL